jgi:2-polyprenyl-3-methyl-5-hydroxy-6-metoxy-1,4-benzoquinol methylase
VERIVPERCRIVDIGAGICAVAEELMEAGYQVTPIDIEEQSLSESIRSILFDGSKIPFTDDAFDLSLFLAVLHHVPKDGQVQLLKEAQRVAPRVLVMEEVYSNTWEKWRTFLLDSFWNLKFFGEPHSNRTDAEWCQLFSMLQYTVKVSESFHLNGFHCVFYLLERNNAK